MTCEFAGGFAGTDFLMHQLSTPDVDWIAPLTALVVQPDELRRQRLAPSNLSGR